MASKINTSGARQGNDYAVPRVPVGDYLADGGYPGNVNYAAPENAGNTQYSSSPVTAWAPVLRVFPGGTPDPGRTKQEPLYQYRPAGDEPPQNWWLGPGPGRIEQQQHNAVESVDAVGWRQFFPTKGTKRAAPDPRRTPPDPSRLTNQLSPANYSYMRPFDQRVPHRMNGQHFSMADHRRTYPILGMAPVPQRRNTYRIDPAPWDTNVVDNTPYEPPAAGRINAVNLPPATNRSFRLT